MTTYASNPGHPFNAEHNKVRVSVSGSWTTVGQESDRAINVVGVKWDGESGSYLQIRDRDGDIWYNFTSEGSNDTIDLFVSPIPLFTKFEYFDSTGSNTIVIYGTYVL